LDKVDQQSYIDILAKGDAGSLSMWPAAQRELAETIQRGEITCAVKDLREGFAEYADNSVDALYLGQMVEHLNVLYELPQFLAECLRMLKPGAPIRVTTPDLAILMGAYMDGDMMRFAPEQPEWYASAPSTAQLSYILFGACGPDCTFDNYEGHFAAFTTAWFAKIMENAGFVGISFNGPKSPEFAECIDCGMSHSFACEARKLL
jgi:hypothetical protein